MNRAFRINVALVFWLGAFLAIALSVWRNFQPYTVPPPRPEFEKGAKATPKLSLPPLSNPTEKPPKASTPPPSPTPSPTESPIATGKVITDVGLILRDEPSSESGGSSGVSYNAEISIVEESADGEWIKIRDDNTGDSGWVRSGNIDRAP